jgi:biopolymer transport protein ExbB
MPDIHAVVESLRAFMATGGPVLWVIGAVAACMGFIIVERYWYVYLVFPANGRATLRRWQACAGMAYAPAHRVRQAMISEARLNLSRMLPLLKALVALCPLLGLLGTVTGMIQVFDVVAALGTGNARAMAAGISRATIPTMAGLLVALPGLYFNLQLEQLTGRKAQELGDRLRTAREARV